MALLNQIYKYLLLMDHPPLITTPPHKSLANNTQYGGLPGHRTTNHIFSTMAILCLHPDIYHLYMDLNKAFNSVPHNSLWKIFSNYNILTYLINLSKNIYAAPYDYPIVNGFALSAAHCIRGPCEAFSMSPIFFNLLIDPMILHIKSLPPTQEFNALFPFTDDIALETKLPRTLHKIIHFLFTGGPLYSLPFNATKSALHALNNAPHVTIPFSSSTHFSTFDNTGNPRNFYKYLGTYFFNQTQNTQMYQQMAKSLQDVQSFEKNPLLMSFHFTCPGKKAISWSQPRCRSYRNSHPSCLT